jgi:Ca2+-transporting ATPase
MRLPVSEPESADWHALSSTDALARLASDANGLPQAEAQRRLAEHGRNAIPVGRRRSVLEMFAAQFRDFMIVILLVAAAISGFIGEPPDTIAILVIVLINAVISTVQEARAEGAVAALRAMAAPDARALRDGRLVTVATAVLVPGDVVVIEAGNIIPADLRLMESEGLQVDESALTGESATVEKKTDALSGRKPALGDCVNLAFKSSLVTHGRGRGVVVATGLATEIGRIADLLRGEVRSKTPLQLRLARFSRYLALAILAICAIVFAAGLLQGQPPIVMFLTAVSLAVAAIPEALPAAVTIALALGARKLIRHKALVRNLPAVETLGSVTTICTDKTGTLTKNQMAAERFVTPDAARDALPQPGVDCAWDEFGTALALNNDVGEIDGRTVGEPTELALYTAAAQAGFDKLQLERQRPRIGELAFDSDRKLMSTVHARDGGAVVYVKGAPERVLERCTGTQELLELANELAREGYRVLAVARREFDRPPAVLEPGTIETDLNAIGLVGLIDPPRAEVPQALADCMTAAVTPIMVTGDHPGTAEAIARRLGIMDDACAIITGDELAALSDADFAARAGRVRVYARVSPEQKLRIVAALQARGEFVAMTGDGVNDAPALKRSNIGVAMGKKGTDIAREAADMVLLDDNFATIVAAVREGRRIFDNIRKFIKYMMSSNAGEIWTLFLAPFLGLPIPLLPIHILWINLVTDGLPALAFSAEPAERGIMRRPPRPTDENLFAHGMWQYIVWVGLLIGAVSLLSQAWAISRGVTYWQTIVFTVLTFAQIFHSLAVRSDSEAIWRIGLFSNLPLLVAIGLTITLQLLVIYVPALNPIFKTEPLPVADLFACCAFALIVLVAVEMRKMIVRLRVGRAGEAHA